MEPTCGLFVVRWGTNNFLPVQKTKFEHTPFHHYNQGHHKQLSFFPNPPHHKGWHRHNSRTVPRSPLSVVCVMHSQCYLINAGAENQKHFSLT